MISKGAPCEVLLENGRALPEGLAMQVVVDFDAIAHLESVLDPTAERLGAPVYMTYDWLKAWWEFYGGGDSLRIYLFWHGRDLAGFLPCYTQRFGAGPLGLRVARLVGANVPPKAFDPPLDPQFAAAGLDLVLSHLFEKERCDLLSFGPVSRLWPAWNVFSSCAQQLNDPALVARYTRRDVRTVFRLPDTFEEYLGAFEPGERKRRMKRLRQLEKTCQITEDIVSGTEATPAEFERFVDLHTRQWEHVGKGGHFAAWPQGLEFNRALVAEQAKHQRVRFFRLLADGQVIANRYTFLFGNTLFSELPARLTGEPWDKRGIGVLSLIRFTGQAIASGAAAVDSGLGAYEHKSSVGGEEVEVGTWRVYRASLADRLRVWAWLLASKLHFLLFQKLWFRRILPKMPDGFPRTQSLSWLRYDY